MDYFSIFDKNMAEILVSHHASESSAPDEWAWGWKPARNRYSTDARPKTLREYYEMDYSNPNNPFSNFVKRGENSWQDDNQLKLEDVAGGGDGSMHIRPKEKWQVKMRVTTDNEEPIATLSDASGVTLYDAAGDANYPNIFYTQANDEYGEPEGETWVILDGDAGDYISIDIDGEESDIGNLAIKAGGHKFSTTEYGLIDKAGYENWAKVKLMGVYYKPSIFGATGVIKEYGSYQIMHDAEAMRIYAVKTDTGDEVVSTLYGDRNTDANALLEYTEGVLDKLEGSLSNQYDEDGCPPNSSYDAEKEECVCHEGYMTDLFGMECIDTSTLNPEAEEEAGCPSNSSLDSDGFCHCDDGYTFSNGVCVLDERENNEPTDYMEIVEKYGMYAVLGLGTLLVVSFLNPKK